MPAEERSELISACAGQKCGAAAGCCSVRVSSRSERAGWTVFTGCFDAVQAVDGGGCRVSAIAIAQMKGSLPFGVLGLLFTFSVVLLSGENDYLK